ncbi:putative disease resistance protein RGA4 [Malania oleifera]|uniref:putative disease resistance protein RGA4 n=1 Tax=Malania oleifera TaxID=397392 RepID=UPI0025AE291F|nr:putative disease resistance protein RGA4 [Malania oleifera]
MGELKKLHRRLLMIQAKLHDAEARWQDLVYVRLWLYQLKLMVEKAEDVLDKDPKSWDLLRNALLGIGASNGKETPDLVGIGKWLLKRCSGLPLALRLPGRLMYSKKIESEWYAMEIKNIWESPNSELRIMPILELSFNHLSPPSLKQCFASCSMHHKDKAKLIQLWAAQGFLQPFEGSKLEMEDKGKEYSNVLLRNSLFHDIEKDKLGNIKRCKKHDLLHYLPYHFLRSEIQRLRNMKVFDETLTARVLLPPMKEIDEFRNLRVVDFSGTGIEQLPDSIGMAKYVKYLEISGTSIKRLPDSFAKLYHLQTLNVEHCKSMEEPPKELRKLINLRHLCLYETNARRLIKEAPIEMGQLVDLQTLWVFVMASRGTEDLQSRASEGDKEEAKNVNLQRKNINSLELRWSRNTDVNNSRIMNHDDEVREGQKPNSNLKILSIEGSEGGMVLLPWISVMMLFQNFVGLKELRTWECPKLDSVPAGFLQLHFLSTLDIVGCRRLSSFPERLICCLMGLKELKIGGFWEEVDTFPFLLCSSCAGDIASTSSSKSIDTKHHHNHHASHLEEVSTFCVCGFTDFDGLEARPEWLPENLQQLDLVDCKNLKYLPSAESMQCLSQLQQLYVNGCRLSEEQCGEETGPECHTIVHIPNKYISG